jgi:serine/threonine-protein kinase RIO1
VRALAQAGLAHPDMSAGNVMLDGTGEAWVIDLDRARRVTRPGPASHRMLARLARSIRKVEARRATPLPTEAWAALRGA